jgi:hypothetical protein
MSQVKTIAMQALPVVAGLVLYALLKRFVPQVP